ncbi:MAG: hypothetical protein ABII93_03730 [Chrysiogenia bacterium]
MRKSLAITLLFCSLAVIAESKITVMPEMAAQVNAYTRENLIPWYSENEFQIKVTAQLSNLLPLVRVTEGDYEYTLYRANFINVRVLAGELQEKELAFYLERRFPTLQSGIKFKELWPFRKGIVLTFKIRPVQDKLLIVSMEK